MQSINTHVSRHIHSSLGMVGRLNLGGIFIICLLSQANVYGSKESHQSFDNQIQMTSVINPMPHRTPHVTVSVTPKQLQKYFAARQDQLHPPIDLQYRPMSYSSILYQSAASCIDDYKIPCLRFCLHCDTTCCFQDISGSPDLPEQVRICRTICCLITTAACVAGCTAGFIIK